MTLPKKYHGNSILIKSFEFAKDVNNYSKVLKQKGNHHLSDQLFRSGTSIGANVWEAQEAESKRDFIHKMKIAAKEAKEAEYWLYLSSQDEEGKYSRQLINQVDEVIRLLSKIIFTTKAKL